VNKGIEKILQCPLTHSDLTILEENQVKDLNVRISMGSVYHLDGTRVQKQLEYAFSSCNGVFVYPVIDGILILRPDLAIPTNKDEASKYKYSIAIEKEAVMRFYDQVGWKQVNEDLYADADRFEDLRPVSREYIHNCHLRVKQRINESGMYLLDVASGPIQYREYLTYSDSYKFRICADISFIALREAMKKLGDKGIYLLCDITNLPLRDNVVDGFVSLHTIYHVPAEEQKRAFEELYRVLKDDRSGVIVYSWGDRSLLMNITMDSPIRWITSLLLSTLPPTVKQAIKKVIRKTPKENPPSTIAVQERELSLQEPQLYFHAHSYQWYREEVKGSFNCDIASWRSVSVPFMKRYVHDRLFGKWLLSFIYWMESTFPVFFGRHGQFPMFICHKQSLIPGTRFRGHNTKFFLTASQVI